jgi:hypothetical protein
MSTLRVCIGLSRNCALNFNMFANMRENTKFLVDKRKICDHFDEESSIARKNLNGPLAGSMGPHTFALSCSRIFGIV